MHICDNFVNTCRKTYDIHIELLFTPTAVVGVRVLPPFVCLSVCLSTFPHDISNTYAAMITKLVIEMFHNESWKPIYFGIKRSKVKNESRRGSLHSGEYWPFLVYQLVRVNHLRCIMGLYME